VQGLCSVFPSPSLDAASRPEPGDPPGPRSQGMRTTLRRRRRAPTAAGDETPRPSAAPSHGPVRLAPSRAETPGRPARRSVRVLGCSTARRRRLDLSPRLGRTLICPLGPDLHAVCNSQDGVSPSLIAHPAQLPDPRCDIDKPRNLAKSVTVESPAKAQVPRIVSGRVSSTPARGLPVSGGIPDQATGDFPPGNSSFPRYPRISASH
jgi:hypothetical protein